MTDFPVKLPYLRSVEVAAAPENARIVLNVYDANQNVVASGEATIVNWRAKVIAGVRDGWIALIRTIET
jgi:hypothetical protein